MDKIDQKTVNTGIISITAKGTGYILSSGFAEDVQVGSEFLNTALHGDEVEFSLFPQADKERLTGEIIKVIKRAKMEFVGTIDKRKDSNISFLIPDDNRMYIDIFLSPNESKNIQNNSKVLVRIEKWDDPKKNPQGKVLRILGKKGDNDVEMESIVLEKGFQMQFPHKVEEEAKLLERHAKIVSPKDISERRDFRDVTTFTIDPDDAKDFDDAISFKEIQDGLFEVGVHIADVSHYIKEGSQLDKEARYRGTSIYLVDRTVPMLPEILSNDICSLNPNQDKLTFATVLTISKDGHIKDVWFGRTIINSNKRFIYEEAQKVMDDQKGPYCYELSELNKLAKIFKERRMKIGGLDFDREEVKFKLDAKGKPISIFEKPRLDVHKLVEEFMVLANSEVASYLSKEVKKINKGASIYRIHDVPKKKAIDDLLSLLRALGHEVEAEGENITSKELNNLLKNIKGKPEESLVNTVAMRSMAKAIYSVDNIGHYGLALENYTHFTSPIRRYADILVHRILQKHLKGGSLTDEEVAWHHKVSMELSKRETDAAEAERSSVYYKQIQYMMDRIGTTCDGIISGITNWGVYVEEKKTKANGMVKFQNMKNDFYVLSRETYSLTGTKTKKKYSIGDEVKIKVIGGDLEKKTLDYAFV